MILLQHFDSFMSRMYSQTWMSATFTSVAQPTMSKRTALALRLLNMAAELSKCSMVTFAMVVALWFGLGCEGADHHHEFEAMAGDLYVKTWDCYPTPHCETEPNATQNGSLNGGFGGYSVDYVTLNFAKINAGFGFELYTGMDETSCLASCNDTWIGTTVTVAGGLQNGMASHETWLEEDWNPSHGSLGRIGACYRRFQTLLLVASVHETLMSSIFCAFSLHVLQLHGCV